MSILCHMRPCGPLLYHCDLARSYPEAFRDTPLDHSGGDQSAYFTHVIIGKFRPGALAAALRLGQAQIQGVKLIKAGAAPLKIFYSIVRLIAIDVVDLIQTILGGNKRFRNETMNRSRVRLASNAERSAHVAVAANPLVYNPLPDNSARRVPRGRFANPLSLNGSHATVRTDFMAILEANDRTPNLIHGGAF